MEKNTNLLGSVLKKIIAENKLSEGLYKAQIKEIWHRIAGDAIMKYTTDVQFEKGVVSVRLSSASLSQELSYGKEQLINHFNQEFGNQVVTKIQFFN